MTYVTALSNGGDYAEGIFNNNSSVTMRNITISVSDGTVSNGGLVTQNASTITLEDATIEASGGDNSVGISLGTGNATLHNVITTGKDGSNSNAGLGINSTNATLVNVQATASGNAATNKGIAISLSNNTTMENVTVHAIGGSTSYGIYNGASDGATLALTNVTVSASEGTNNYGLYNHGNTNLQTIHINRSHLSGSHSIRNDSAYTVRVASSKLEGGIVANGGQILCLYSYNENYTPLPTNPCGPTGEPISNPSELNVNEQQ